MSENEKLVEVQHLQQYFPAGGRGKHKKFVQAVDDVSFFINKGETLGLVGESGCGKTTVGRTLLRLYEPTDGKIIYDGNVIFDKENKVAVNMLPFRRKMQMVFQDPYASLDPRMTIGDIVGEPIDIHHLAANKAERREKIISLLERVGLNSEHANRYPHEFSGGQRQRVALGRAIVLILICINVYKDPAFYQRFTASNGPKTGKRAMLTCFSIWLSMDVCLMFTAIVICAMDPALTVQPEVAYMQLVLSSLPPVGRGLFVFAMLGAIISTMDTYYLVGGEIVSNDIIGVLRKKPLTDKQSIFISRIACVVFGVIGLSVAFKFKLVYDAMILVTSLSMSALFVPMMAAIMYDGKKTNMSGLCSMIVGILSWLWFDFNPLSIEALGGNVDPMLVSLPMLISEKSLANREL